MIIFWIIGLNTNIADLFLFFYVASTDGYKAALLVKNTPANAGDTRHGFDPWVRKIPWRRAQQPTPGFLPGESHGQRSLAGYCPRDHKESDITEQLSAYSFRMLRPPPQMGHAWYPVIW